LWITAAFLIGGGVVLIVFLLKPKSDTSFPPNLGITDLTGIISLAVNAALFIITIVSLSIAVAAYRASVKSGEQQLETLKRRGNPGWKAYLFFSDLRAPVGRT
jgi:hypothetical protein